MSGSLGEQETLWEPKSQAGVSTAFEFSQTLRVFLKLDRNTENMFSVSFIEHHNQKKGKQLVNFDYQNVSSLCLCHHYINSLCKL